MGRQGNETGNLQEHAFFHNLCWNEIRKSVQFIQINHAAKTLYDVTVDGKFCSTVISR